MKRAQMEIMGLIIIVILVTVAMFFSIALRKPPTAKKTLDVYTDETLAGNYLVTLLKMRVETCESATSIVTMKDIAEDCIRILGPNPQQYQDNNYDFSTTGFDSNDFTEGTPKYDSCGDPSLPQNSCVLFRQTVDALFDDTLDLWGVSYRFNFIYTYGTTQLDLLPLTSEPPCGTLVESIAGIQHFALPYDVRGKAFIQLDVCRP